MSRSTIHGRNDRGRRGALPPLLLCGLGVCLLAVPIVAQGPLQFDTSLLQQVPYARPTELFVSPDELDVYVLNGDRNTWSDDDVLTHFRVDESGDLVLVSSTIVSYRDLDISPDGLHVRTITGAGIVTLSRDPGTGALTVLHTDPWPAVRDYNAAHGPHLVHSPDGKHLYATRYGTLGLVVYRIEGNETLTVLEEFPGLKGQLLISPGGEHLYVYLDAFIRVYTRNATTGALTFVQEVQNLVGGVSGLEDPRAGALSPDGTRLYLADWSSDAVLVFTRDTSTGLLGFFAEYSGFMVDGRVALKNANGLVLGPDGDEVYVAAARENAHFGHLVIFDRDSGDGSLTFRSSTSFADTIPTSVKSGADLLLRPDGGRLWALRAEAGGWIWQFDRDGSGDLAEVAPTPIGTIEHPSLSPYDGSLAPASELLTILSDEMLESWRLQLHGATLEHDLPLPHLYERLVHSPDGAHVYLTSQSRDAVAAYSRDGEGAFALVQELEDDENGVEGLDSPTALAVSPDGMHLYVVNKSFSSSDATLTIFERDTTSGVLTYLTHLTEGVEVPDGLDGPEALRVTPDGLHVIVVSSEDDSVLVLERDPSTGLLTFVERHRDDYGALRAIAIDSTGSFVYALSTVGEIWRFERNAMSGFLTETGMDSLEDLDLEVANRAELSPDDEYLYVSDPTRHLVAILERDLATGALERVQVRREGVAGVSGMKGPQTIVVHPRGDRVIVPSRQFYRPFNLSRGGMAFFWKDSIFLDDFETGDVTAWSSVTSEALSPFGTRVP